MIAGLLRLAVAGHHLGMVGGAIDVLKGVRAGNTKEHQPSARNSVLTPATNRWRFHLAQLRYAECPAEGINDFAGVHVLLLCWV